MTDTVQISMDDAVELIAGAVRSSGVTASVATSVARALVAAEAEGQVGHGFSRLADYVAQAKSGKVNAQADVSVSHRGPASVFVDADQGFAYPAMEAALEAGLPLVDQMGVAVMAIGNSHHCGALSVQVEKIAQAGFIGMMVANTPKAIAPWGAREAIFGTNPIAFASPRAEGPPLVIDLSLSVVARGKVMAARKAYKDIPLGWALDAEGQPTTDPEAALAGTMVPIGDAKGTALALMVEILAAAFTGSAFSKDAGSFFHAEGAPPRVGQTMIGIKPDPASGFAPQVEELLGTISAMEGVRLPGDRRRQAIEAAEANGLHVPAAFIATARALAG